MATNLTEPGTSPSQRAKKSSGPGPVLLQFVLRTVAVASSLAASVIMATNKQRFGFVGIFHMVADYKASPCFRFLVAGTAAAGLYSLISLPFVFVLHFQGSKPKKSFFMHLFDLMIMSLVLAATAAATGVAYVGKKGNTVAGWSPICGFVSHFCNKTELALLLSYVSLLILFLILIV
ncbi:hypothetical protein MRB53_027416 [Persea americana]|uniref:Uncharacterized protein n=1 Tax=Persea americana TaxID=3435 RepID=A0ACC2LKU1_PERAE|nr:hypothetical protein MRB53_027416 [Persea americana]